MKQTMNMSVSKDQFRLLFSSIKETIENLQKVVDTPTSQLSDPYEGEAAGQKLKRFERAIESLKTLKKEDAQLKSFVMNEGSVKIVVKGIVREIYLTLGDEFKEHRANNTFKYFTNYMIQGHDKWQQAPLKDIIAKSIKGESAHEEAQTRKTRTTPYVAGLINTLEESGIQIVDKKGAFVTVLNQNTNKAITINLRKRDTFAEVEWLVQGEPDLWHIDCLGDLIDNTLTKQKEEPKVHAPLNKDFFTIKDTDIMNAPQDNAPQKVYNDPKSSVEDQIALLEEHGIKPHKVEGDKIYVHTYEDSEMCIWNWEKMTNGFVYYIWTKNLPLNEDGSVNYKKYKPAPMLNVIKTKIKGEKKADFIQYDNGPAPQRPVNTAPSAPAPQQIKWEAPKEVETEWLNVDSVSEKMQKHVKKVVNELETRDHKVLKVDGSKVLVNSIPELNCMVFFDCQMHDTGRHCFQLFTHNGQKIRGAKFLPKVNDIINAYCK
jgi:hypothetical protein